jgi:hypothetical protein
MDALYHHQILKRALGAPVSLRALEAIYRANIGQDLRGLFGHPEYHFDENAIVESLAYIEECRALATRTESPAEAWSAFGRLSHAAQDFYAHSNYVRLWAAQFDGRAPLPDPREAPPERRGGGPLVGKISDRGREWPPVESMDGLDPSLLKHPRLMTCRMYWPVEALYFVPGLGPLVKRFLPKDAHAWMNLDNPKTGRLFPYAMEAAVQRTVAEYERTLAAIGEERGEEAVKAFCDV